MEPEKCGKKKKTDKNGQNWKKQNEEKTVKNEKIGKKQTN